MKLNIGIIGTRGIPNNYGGYEQFAELFSVLMAQRGHHVTVYNSSLHPYGLSNYNGVKIVRAYDPENVLGTAGQFIYDYNCIKDCRNKNYDIILQLGYTSSSVWSFLFPSKSVVITNMDGLEWKRTKYSKPVQWFLKQAERWAANKSDCLIADNRGIQQYLLQKYNKQSAMIAYGADVYVGNDSDALNAYSLKPYNYNLVIARMEPENNVETIIKGHADNDCVLVIVGNTTNAYGKYLRGKYESNTIKFINGIYNATILNQLRRFCNLYFHGHSVGGTNPSLLEAMAAGALIVAHNNVFNKSVLDNNAFYFSNAGDIQLLLNTGFERDDYQKYITRNMNKLEHEYNWQTITTQLEDLFVKQVNDKRKVS